MGSRAGNKVHLKIFYWVKPFVSRRVQLGLRRWIAAYKKKTNAGTWPINRAASRPPEGWPGWPEGKKFAVALTHDVDKGTGCFKCVRLMSLEEQLGFRSSFNFVAEDYAVDEGLRESLVKSGFEVGLHGLKHDGKLFSNRSFFETRSARINHYIEKWGASGFRAPAMHHNLEWLTDLNIEYDSSTFDTDPFEPVSDGCSTIFPFWYANQARTRGYVEIPYTLPQDHCLFVIMKERDIAIWKTKLDWVAQKGGLALLNTHPDYMNFEGTSCAREEYPVAYYAGFLEYLKTRYAGQYWHALPRDVARFWRNAMPSPGRPPEKSA